MAVITINYTIDGYSASGDSNVSATTVAAECKLVIHVGQDSTP